MTPAEDARLRAVAASAPGYACYPGQTPPGNPRRIVLPAVSWARTVDQPRPLAEITPTQPIPPALGPLVRPRPPMTRMLDQLRDDMAPVLAMGQVEPEPEPIVTTHRDTGGMTVHYPSAIAAEIATAAPPQPGERRRWWHYMTTRRP